MEYIGIILLVGILIFILTPTPIFPVLILLASTGLLIEIMVNFGSTGVIPAILATGVVIMTIGAIYLKLLIRTV